MREDLRVMASVGGIHAEVGGRPMLDLAAEVLEISQAGLKARAVAGNDGLVPDETHFLNALQETVSEGRSMSDELLDRYQGEWGGDLGRIYDEYSY